MENYQEKTLLLWLPAVAWIAHKWCLVSWGPHVLSHGVVSVKTQEVHAQHPGDQVASLGPGTESTPMPWKICDEEGNQ